MSSSKEPTRHQLSSKLAYSSSTPSFLQKLKNQMAGIPNEPEDEEDEEWEYDGSGRPPIPKRPKERPPIPERPDGDKGSEDEDGDDEKPQVVVLKEGKHLTEREAENIRRKEKGLPPLPEEEDKVAKNEPSSTKDGEKGASDKTKPVGLSFSSGGASTKKGAGAKRKAIGDLEKDSKDSKSAPQKKKPKKEKKTLLSFGDDA